MSKQPNVLFFLDDQLRWDACSVYGGRNITTPNIDQLAAEGMLFVNALSTCPLCTPYRGMLMTGRYGTHTGIVLNFVETNPNQQCIAHTFKSAGYRTGFIGKWHLGAGPYRFADKHEARVSDKYASELTERYGLEGDALAMHLIGVPDFDFVPPGPQRLGFEHWAAYNFHAEFRNAWYYADTPDLRVMTGYETDAETRMAIDFMAQCREDGDPFFLVLAPHPPHAPFVPDQCPEGYLDDVPQDLWWPPNVPDDHPRRTDPAQVRCYYAMVKNIDDNVGKLIAFLDEAGLSEDTIVVFTSDHGEQHGSHGYTEKMVPYAESVRVPLLIRRPGHIPEGARTDVLYTPMDHMPTLCSLVGVQAPTSCDGDDLSAFALGEGADGREAALMMNYTSYWNFFQSGTMWPEWRGVKTKRYTYVKWLTGREELYDDLDDPYQMVNLADNAEKVAERDLLRCHLQVLLAEADDDFRPGTGYAEWYGDQRRLLVHRLNM